MSRFNATARVVTALAVLSISGPVWLLLVLYSGIEQLGGRSHPVVDLVGWSALAVMVAAAAVVSVETVNAVLRRLRGRS